MKNKTVFLRFFLTPALILFLLLTNLQGVSAARPSPTCDGTNCTLSNRPVVEGSASYEPVFAPTSVQTPRNLPALKAVLVVGPIDGADGPWTTKEISYAEMAAVELEAHGVKVERFYGANAKWDQIVAAAAGAHFFMYRGHGIRWSQDPEVVGGFFLANDQAVSSSQIQEQLHLATNAIVMMYACFSAGTTNDDLPPGISLQTAYDRVSMYSEPFFANGAGGYYADWYGQAFQLFIADLFKGYTLGQAYQNFDFDPATLSQHSHPTYPSQALWLDTHFYAEQTQYNHAFVGSPEKNLEDLFGPVMKVGPTKIEYVTETAAAPKEFDVSVENYQPDFQFTWTADLSGEGEWVSLSQTTGEGGQSLKIQLNPQAVAPGTYSATLHIVSNTPGVVEPVQDLPVNLTVVEDLPAPSVIYIPFVVAR